MTRRDDVRGEIRQLLTTRRDKATPTQAGLPTYGGRRHLARFVLLDPKSKDFYGDWDGIAHAAVGSLRAEAGRAPHDRALTELVGELSLHSHEVRVRWATHDVASNAVPGSPARQALDLLASWTATPDKAPAITSDADT